MVKTQAGAPEEVIHAPSIRGEFEGAHFGDARLSGRLVTVAEGLARSPGASVRASTQRRCEEDGAYRLLSHPAVNPGAILQPHVDQTVRRIAEAGVALIAHDTTECQYHGEREGLGRLRGSQHEGFLAHMSLAMTADGTRRPLGMVGLHLWTRQGPVRSKSASGKVRNGSDYAQDADKESLRWFAQVTQARERVGDGAQLVHLADREGDAYPFLAKMQAAGDRFVVRMARDRVARSEDDPDLQEKVRALLGRAENIAELDVPLARRDAKPTPGSNKLALPRESRDARLALAAAPIEIRRPDYLTDLTPWLSLNVVCVRELDPPEGVDPVEWVLFTTEPIDSWKDVLKVVEYYRARWLIEEFFKALKTGCELEKRELESYEGLVNVLAILIPVAWQMLLLRSLARSQPDLSAEVALTPTQLDVLRACGHAPLSHQPNVRQALFAVAALGGHHNNRPPGWIVIGRGMEKLILLEIGWTARKDTTER
jgi:hypothetical protein